MGIQITYKSDYEKYHVTSGTIKNMDFCLVFGKCLPTIQNLAGKTGSNVQNRGKKSGFWIQFKI